MSTCYSLSHRTPTRYFRGRCPRIKRSNVHVQFVSIKRLNSVDFSLLIKKFGKNLLPSTLDEKLDLNDGGKKSIIWQASVIMSVCAGLRHLFGMTSMTVISGELKQERRLS